MNYVRVTFLYYFSLLFSLFPDWGTENAQQTGLKNQTEEDRYKRNNLGPRRLIYKQAGICEIIRYLNT